MIPERCVRVSGYHPRASSTQAVTPTSHSKSCPAFSRNFKMKSGVVIEALPFKCTVRR